jgi:hypothetical protein
MVVNSSSWFCGDGLRRFALSVLAQRAASEGPRWTRTVESRTASAHCFRVGERKDCLSGAGGNHSDHDLKEIGGRIA